MQLVGFQRDTGGGGGRGGHSSWFWVPNAEHSKSCGCRQKRGGCHRPKNSQKGGCQRGNFLLGMYLVAWLFQGKNPGLAIISVLAIVVRVIVLG